MMPRRRGQHLRALLPLALPERRRRDVQNERGALPHLLLYRIDLVQPLLPVALVVPGVLADGQRHQLVADLHHFLVVGRCEVPLLIEDVVERQQHLALGKGDLALLHQHGRVAHALARTRRRRHQRAADHRDRFAGGRLARNLRRSLARQLHEGRLLYEIARRIAADAQLRKDHQVCAAPLRLAYILQNSCCVPSKIRDRWIDLRQRNLHTFSVSENAMQKRPAPGLASLRPM